jgi:hypothetical protein
VHLAGQGSADDATRNGEGVIPKVAEALFAKLRAATDILKYDVKVSFVEVYNVRRWLFSMCERATNPLPCQCTPTSRTAGALEAPTTPATTHPTL